MLTLKQTIRHEILRLQHPAGIRRIRGETGVKAADAEDLIADMFEAEIKVIVRDKARIHMALLVLSGYNEDAFTYFDEYYDTPLGDLKDTDRELRLRQKKLADRVDLYLTAKTAAFEKSSRSKQEFELQVTSIEQARGLLRTLGFEHKLSFEKKCLGYTLSYGGLPVSALLVTIPELSQTYLELEISAADEKAGRTAIDTLRGLRDELGIPSEDECPDYYTDLVEAVRASANR